MKQVVLKGKDAFLLSLKKSSIMFINLSNTLQALFEKKGDNFLCIIKKYGTITFPEEAISLSLEEYKNSFGKCIKEHWFFSLFTNKKIITEPNNKCCGFIKIWSITEQLILARDDNKQWYSVEKNILRDPFTVGDIVPPEMCEVLDEASSEFHEGIKELSDAVYGEDN